MKYSAKDIEIFVLTYNRANFLEQALYSIYNQSEKGFRLIVLDNGSDDHTCQVLDRFKPYGIEIYRNKRNLGVNENFKKAQQLAEKKWTMVFHDDDLLHHDYVSTIINVINTNDGLVLVGSGMLVDKDPKPIWYKLKGKVKYFYSASDFAAYLYNGFHFAFCSSVYKTELFKTISDRPDIYGKIADRPFLFDIARHGFVAVLTEPYVKYRSHPGQDIKTNVNGPFLNELISLHKKYFELLGDNMFSRTGRIFILNNYRHMRFEASRLSQIQLSEYLQKAIDAGATTKRALLYGKLLFPLVYARGQLRRVFYKVRSIYRVLKHTSSYEVSSK